MKDTKKEVKSKKRKEEKTKIMHKFDAAMYEKKIEKIHKNKRGRMIKNIQSEQKRKRSLLKRLLFEHFVRDEKEINS